MQKQIIFGSWETICLLINLTFMQIFLGFPRFMTKTGGTAGWITTIYVFILIMLLFGLISKLFKRFPGKDILDIADDITGKPGRIIIGVSYTFITLLIAAMVLREFSETVKTIALPVSPLSYILGFFLFGAIISCFTGMESIIRLQAVGVPIISFFFILILLLIFPHIRFEHLLPIMGNGVSSVFGEGTLRLSVFIALYFLFFFPPYLKTFQNFKFVGYTFLSISGFFMISTMVTYLSIVPYPTALESTIPIYSLSRMIDYGRFFQRIEPLFVSIWVFSAYLYFSSLLFLCIYSFKKTFELPYLKPLVILFSILTFTIAILPKSFMSAYEIADLYIRKLGFIPSFSIPLILLLLAWIRGKGEVKKYKAQKN